MRVLGLIPARGGSKGIPRKNLRELCGKPLLQYVAETSLRARRLSRVVLSTDDLEIAELGHRCGLEVPFLRPPELATDEAAMLPVVQHAVRCLEKTNESYDAVCLLQPTNPLRRPEDIDACIDLLETSGADAVVTILLVPEKYNPHWVYFRDKDHLLHLSCGDLAPISRRQDLPPAFHREGSVYITRRDVLMETNSLYGKRLIGYALSPDRCVNVDNAEDWERAAFLISRKLHQVVSTDLSVC